MFQNVVICGVMCIMCSQICFERPNVLRVSHKINLNDESKLELHNFWYNF